MVKVSPQGLGGDARPEVAGPNCLVSEDFVCLGRRLLSAADLLCSQFGR